MGINSVSFNELGKSLVNFGLETTMFFKRADNVKKENIEKIFKIKCQNLHNLESTDLIFLFLIL